MSALAALVCRRSGIFVDTHKPCFMSVYACEGQIEAERGSRERGWILKGIDITERNIRSPKKKNSQQAPKNKKTRLVWSPFWEYRGAGRFFPLSFFLPFKGWRWLELMPSVGLVRVQPRVSQTRRSVHTSADPAPTPRFWSRYGVGSPRNG